jgi:glycosyltransferase involved in cell wall biosynthesis
MRILHVVGKLDYGGVETWLVQVLRHIDRRKYQMDFLVHTADPGAYDEEVRALGSRVIPCLNPSNPLQYAWNFRRALREHGPYDVVHSHIHHYGGYVLLLAMMAGVSVRIAHSHSDSRAMAGAEGLARLAYLKTMQVMIGIFATSGLAVSSEAGDQLFRKNWRNYPEQWQLQHLGIDLSRFDIPVDRNSLRRAIGIPRNAYVIGHVGRFAASKNHAFLVEIAREAVRMEPRSFFLLVGDGPLRVAIEEKVRSYGLTEHFKFAGVRPDVPALMKNAMDILLFPSLFEGLPVTLLEAQAAGLMSVISDVVSREADLVPGLIAREPQQTSATEWAQHLLRHLQQRIRAPIDIDLVHRSLAARSIAVSTEHLSALYSTHANSSHL